MNSASDVIDAIQDGENDRRSFSFDLRRPRTLKHRQRDWIRILSEGSYDKGGSWPVRVNES